MPSLTFAVDLIDPERFALQLAQRDIRLMAGYNDARRSGQFVRKVLTSEGVRSTKFKIETTPPGTPPRLIFSRQTALPVGIALPLSAQDPVTLLHLVGEVIAHHSPVVQGSDNQQALFAERYNQLVRFHLPDYWQKFRESHVQYSRALQLGASFAKPATREAIVLAMYAGLDPRREVRGTYDRDHITIDSHGADGAYGEMVISKKSGNVLTATLYSPIRGRSRWEGAEINNAFRELALDRCNVDDLPLQFAPHALTAPPTTPAPDLRIA